MAASDDDHVRWRGAFANDEFHVLHAEAFETRIFDDDWVALRAATASAGSPPATATTLVGFVNVIWDGLVHAWIQDVMVAESTRGPRHRYRARGQSRASTPRRPGCEWLHVDFDDDLRAVLLRRLRVPPTNAGLIALQR